MKIRCLILILCLLSLTYGYAESPRMDHVSHQKKLKETFFSNKKNIQSRTSKQKAIEKKSQYEVKSEHASKLSALRSSVYLKFKKFSALLRGLVGRAWYAIIRQKHNLSHQFFPKQSVVIHGTPPEAGGIYYELASDGDRPIVRFSTDEEITDDGVVETIVWNFGDGTSQTFNADFLDEYAYVAHVYPTPGHYSVTLSITDDESNTTYYQRYVNVMSNERPLPIFTVNTNVGTAPLSVDFTLTGDDPEGQLTQVRWRSGDGTTDFNNNFNHTYTANGTYTVQLRLRDDPRGQSYTTAQIFVGDTPPSWGSVPSIVFQSSNLAGKGPLTVYFDASNSFDIDGEIANYSWDFGDSRSVDNFSESATPSHVYSRPGTYVGEVTVMDMAGGESTYYFEVFVHAEEVLSPRLIAYQYDNSRNIEFDNSILALRSAVENRQYIWTSGDSHNDVGSYFEHEYSSNGTYAVSIEAYDIFGNFVSDTLSLTVTDTNDMPEAELEVEWQPVQILENVLFDASGSSDPNQAAALTYMFDFADGTQLETSSSSTSHSYSDRGFFNVKVFVTNSRGISAGNHADVKVNNGLTPFADIQYTPKVGTIPLNVTASASGSFAQGTTIKNYYWSTSDDWGYKKGTDTLTHTFTEEGEYYFDLIVEDEFGNLHAGSGRVYAYDSGSVPSGNQAPIAGIVQDVDTNNNKLYYFDAETNSSDPDGNSLVYEWRVNGQMVGSAYGYLQYEFADYNYYTVELTVYDQWGLSDTDTVQIDLSVGVLDQLAIHYSPLKPIINEDVRFGADHIVVPGSTIVSYNWDFGDSSTGSGAVVDHAYTTAGTYDVELTLTDSSSNTFVVETAVVVAATTTNPTIKIIAQDVDLISETTNSGTYRATSFPETVHYTVRGTSNSNKYIKKATWDFGDGQTGFGPDVAYTYTRPGTYSVSVTGYDANNLSSTATMTVIVPNNCKRQEGQTECLELDGLSSHFLPFSQSSWIIERTGNFSSNSLYFPKDWIVLKSLDAEGKKISIGDIVTVASNQVTISKAGIVNKNIDLGKSYKIILNTKDSSDNPIFAEVPMIRFTPGQLKITSSDEDMLLTISQEGSGYHRFVDMGSNMSMTLSDIPVGQISVVAQTDSFFEAYIVEVGTHTPGLLEIDTAIIIPRKLAQKSTPVPFSEIIKKHEALVKQDYASKNRTLPAWSGSLCGEESPFTGSKERILPPGTEVVWPFDTWNLDGENYFRDIPENISKPVRLNCSIRSESLVYSHNAWKYKNGPQRCWDTPSPHWYWDWYLKQLKFEDSIVQIKYQVRDDWTNENYYNVISTSARAMQNSMGGDLSRISQKVGLMTDDLHQWAYTQQFNIFIPPHFKRPQIRFLMNAEEQDAYYVGCDVVAANSYEPKVIGLKVASLNNASDLDARNAQYSLQQRYNYFPVHFNDSGSSAHQLDSDATKATYLVSIRYYNQSSITWDSVDVEFSYNNVTHTENYPLTGTPIVDVEQGILTQAITVDTAALETVFNWSSKVDRIYLTVTPKGEDASSAPVTGLALIKEFIPMFDVQAVEAEQSLDICSNDYFGTNYTTFVQDSLVRAVYATSGDGIGVRCSSASMPFGGPMDISGLEKNTHQHGLELSVRSFNEDSTAQDNYDGTEADLRVTDLDVYKGFVSEALTISQIIDEYDLMSQPTDKKKLFDFCKPTGFAPKYPCDEATTFSSLSHDMVVNLCQWYSDTGSELDGCPTNYLDEIKRFSAWVKLNANAIKTVQSHGSTLSMVSGIHFDSTLYTAEQKDAIVRGVWPDGRPIWEIASSGEEMTQARVIDCHANKKGCEGLMPVFNNPMMTSESNVWTHSWSIQ